MRYRMCIRTNRHRGGSNRRSATRPGHTGLSGPNRHGNVRAGTTRSGGPHRRFTVAAALGVLFLAAAAGPVQVSAQNLPAPEELVTAAQDNLRFGGYEAVTRLIINDGRGNERVRQLAMISGWFPEEDVEKRLIRFMSPADVAGTGLLTYDYEDQSDDMWLYLPALRRSRRLSSNEKSGNFMGSEFTYADMTALSLADFEYTVAGRETIRGRECYILEQRPASRRLEREYGFVRREIAMLVDMPVIWQSEYYDGRGRLARTLTASEVEQMSPGHHRPMRMEMKNEQNGRFSVLVTDQWQVSDSMSEEYFTVAYLEEG